MDPVPPRLRRERHGGPGASLCRPVGAGRDAGLRGHGPVHRFQRAAYFGSLLPRPADEQQAVAAVLAVTRNASVPFGAPYRSGRFATYNTEYRTVCDLAGRRYFLELATSPNLLRAELDRFDLSPGAPVMTLDPHDLTLVGNVSGAFTPAPAPF
ncbi:linear amide C-N hydrolase [Streptomyces sp. NPDC085612]|uniref:linear amide C-N hydrolase n=1 Tax=Streptomyces sp. NPDC085612 TaxID=3365732 RepID=UPI0037CF2CA0